MKNKWLLSLIGMLSLGAAMAGLDLDHAGAKIAEAFAQKSDKNRANG